MPEPITGTTKHPRIGIVGGLGAMGRWFHRVFEAVGLEVEVADRDTPLSNGELARRVDIVVVAVPIGVTAAVMQELLPALRADQLLVDLTSVKTPVVDLLRSAPGEVLSLHPMFGPSAPSLEGQVVVVCPIRRGSRAPLLESVLREQGAILTETDPETHDRMMAVIQGVTHFQSIVAAHCLGTLGIDMDRSLEFASPVYRARIVMMGRILAQDPRLYAEIQTLNPYIPEVLEALLDSSRALLERVRTGDTAGVADMFSEAAGHLGSFKERALAESNRMIAALGAKRSDD
jgi:prephenate dehydrogenase